MSTPEKALHAVLQSDTAPSAAQEQRFLRFLQKKYQTPVTLSWERDETLSGGFRMTVGADV